MQLAPRCEDPSIQRVCKGNLREGQWSRDKEFLKGTQLTGHVSECDSASPNTKDGREGAKCNVVPLNSARTSQGHQNK